MKMCSRYQKGLCQQSNPQPLEEFNKNNQQKTGLHPQCKSCRSQQYFDNPDEIRARALQNYVDNPERVRANVAKWAKTNPKRKRAIEIDWRHSHPGEVNNWLAIRRASKLQATPSWLSKEQRAEMKDFYVVASMMSGLCPEPMHVDHIRPLRGKNVCGLHVPWNLQIIPKSVNIKKSNKMD